MAKQRWRNRGDQKVLEGRGWLPAYQNFMSGYLTNLYVVGFAFVLFMVFIVQRFPRLALVQQVLGLW